MPSVAVHDCTPDRWDDVVAVFEGPGDPGRCWCQWFYRGGVADRVHAEANRAALREQLGGERPPGVLGYLDGVPLGWSAVAPRPTYTRLTRSKVLEGTPPDELTDPGVWSVTCFVVRREARKQGLSGALLDGAIELARRGGATVVEGYPVDAAARNKPSAAELYHGTLGTFLRAGFEVVATHRPGRAVVRLAVR
jgi:GNAT superfamily N-acetyltransferase